MLSHLHDHVAQDKKLHMTFVRGVRLAPRFHQGEILNPIRHVGSVTRCFQRRRGQDCDAGDSPAGSVGRLNADGRADIRVQRRPVVRDELDPNRMGARGQRERERLDGGQESDVLGVEEHVGVTFGRGPDLPQPPGLNEYEVRHAKVNEDGSAIRNQGSIGRRDDREGGRRRDRRRT